MEDFELNLAALWDPSECRGPFTIFTYPCALADENRLPRDAESLRYLAALVTAGVRVGIWEHACFPGDVYFVCPPDEIQSWHAAATELDRYGVFPIRFTIDRSEYLFSLVSDTQEAESKTVIHVSPER